MNYSQVAREYSTKRQRVKFWVERYQEEGIKGLKDRCRAPHHIPHKTSKEIEEKIKEIAKAKKYSIGQDRIQSELRKEEIRRSTSTINRILHSLDLIKKRLKKYQRKREVSEYRKKLKALRNWQIDVKDLIDIPNIYVLVYSGIIPRFEYTAKDVIGGTTFLS